MIKNIVILLFFSTLILPFNTLLPVVIASVSIPKAGSHLLGKVLKMIAPEIKENVQPPELCIFTKPTLKRVLSKKNCFLSAHAIFTPFNINQLQKHNIKTFFISRDPRDQIVSTAFMVKKSKKQWPLHYSWSLDDLITELIVGGGPIWSSVFGSPETWRSLKGIEEFYNLYLPWQFEPNVYATTFEKLVGERGGGNAESQVKEIMAIAQHMSRPITKNIAQQIAKRLFGGTLTFREGQIGSWKKHFKPHHIKLFNETVSEDFVKKLGLTL